MLITITLDDGLIDRSGCGDELYLDARLKAASRLASLKSSPLDLGLDLELDFSEDAGDDVAAH